ncbi:hypothetical protein MKX03_002503 [Papaver bracteatum]|nr:hypothetical protein MKX03_002503 [Papaver bracteatum]
METHFLSSSVKKIKLIGNDMWDVATERRYTKLVEKLHMLSSISLYLRKVERRTLLVCGLKWIKMAEHHRVISLGVIMKVVTDQKDLAVQEMEHQDSLEKIWVVLHQSIIHNIRFKPSPWMNY